MGTPTVKSGKFHAGKDCVIGENVVIDVAEEVVFGDRCVIPDNAYLGGRRVTVGDDFYGYSWDFSRLDVGTGRRDDEYAVLTVGSRCTFHNNRIDLACEVVIGNDVGLSPDVVIYTHYYWQSVLRGYPINYSPVVIGDKVLVGFRSVILPRADIGNGVVVGAQSVVSGSLDPRWVYAGNPAKKVRSIDYHLNANLPHLFDDLVAQYVRSLDYRGYRNTVATEFPFIHFEGCQVDVVAETLDGTESLYSDDLRDFLFKHGIRVYTERPFRKLPRR